jgi:hypothetical protein
MTRGSPLKIGSPPNAKGPTIIPANNSPRTTGIFIRWNSSANNFAAKRRIAREIMILRNNAEDSAVMVFYHQGLVR